MEDSENSLPSLLCKEDESCLEELYHYKDEDLDFCSVSESDSEYIEMLIQKETIFQSNGYNSSVKSERCWWKCARRDAIKWILDVCFLISDFVHTFILQFWFDYYC